jgi:hypothetical protein
VQNISHKPEELAFWIGSERIKGALVDSNQQGRLGFSGGGGGCKHSGIRERARIPDENDRALRNRFWGALASGDLDTRSGRQRIQSTLRKVRLTITRVSRKNNGSLVA